MLKAKFGFRFPDAVTPDVSKIQVSYSKRITSVKEEAVTEDLDVVKTFYGKRMNVETANAIEFGTSASLLKNIPRDGLVLELLFFEGAGTAIHDTSGNNNNGAIYGAVWDELSTGKRVLSFDGVDDYVEIPDSPTLNPTDEITVISWVMSLEQYPPYPAGLVLKSSWWGEYGFIFEKNGKVSFPVGESNTKYTKPWSTEILPANQWTMITLVAKAYEYVKGYFNLEIVAEATMDHAIGDTANPLYIGKYGGSCFYGFIGLVRIYNRALSEDEIKSLYELEAPLFGITP